MTVEGTNKYVIYDMTQHKSFVSHDIYDVDCRYLTLSAASSGERLNPEAGAIFFVSSSSGADSLGSFSSSPPSFEHSTDGCDFGFCTS